VRPLTYDTGPAVVSETFTHTRACPGETAAHSRGTSIPAVCRLAESVRNHDGAATSITTAEMPAPITAPTITTTAMTAPTKHPRAATATITNKSSRASLQLTHELGGYVRRMHSRAPTENEKNLTNIKIVRLSLSTTPQLPLRLGSY
jgi:type IV secretory pathway VirJ component